MQRIALLPFRFTERHESATQRSENRSGCQIGMVTDRLRLVHHLRRALGMRLDTHYHIQIRNRVRLRY